MYMLVKLEQSRMIGNSNYSKCRAFQKEKKKKKKKKRRNKKKEQDKEKR